MTGKDKLKGVSFRLTEENNEKLINIANSFDMEKSTMAASIIVNYLNDNWDAHIVNVIAYPRPIVKRIVALYNREQIEYVIKDIIQYNKDMIASLKNSYTNEKIFGIYKKWLRQSGCEVLTTSSNLKQILEIHHEMERNWSEITCVTFADILQSLDKKIERTFVSNDWFKIEYY